MRRRIPNLLRLGGMRPSKGFIYNFLYICTMQSRATAKIRITITPEIIATSKAYTKGLQFCINTAWNKKIRNNVKLHPFVYSRLRERFKLPAQLAIACIKQACGMVKKARSKPIINKAAVRYNFPRSANIKGNILVLRLLNKRQEFKLNIPDCYKEYFNWDVKESLLRIDRKGRCFFLFTFSKDIIADNSVLQNKVLGIDVGVNNLAVTSDSRFYNSSKVRQIKRKFKYLRSKLQTKGTRSSKRLLRKISGRETRFMAWHNHNISKDIVSSFNGNRIVMENLKGIRKLRRGKRMNYWLSNWSFYQLQSFIAYKAERNGIKIIKVRPYMTSQICHRCGHLGSRSNASFACSHCNLSSYSADLNAARNLAHPMLAERQAAITQPYSTCHDAKAVFGTAVEHSAKYLAL